MKTIHFNTGRSYTRFGQRITATLHDDGVVTFQDHDRNVDGEYKALPIGEGRYHFTKESVLSAYDACLAPNSHRSWKDAMLVGGCNSKYEEGRLGS